MRLLIADDDDYTREGLAETVDWRKFGVDHISLARDGEEALLLAASEHPDIVLTDIRMPKLNGIEFAERMGEVCSGNQLLFMSGYMDMSYLKSAIKLSAVDYIEKPIKLHELEQAVLKAVQHIEEKNTISSISRRNRELESYELADRVIGQGQDLDTICSLCDRVGFPTDAIYVCVRFGLADGRGDSDDLLHQSLAYWEQRRIAAIGHYLKNEQCYIITAFRKQDLSMVRYLLEQYVHQTPQLVAGIGQNADCLASIPYSYITSERAIARFFYHQDKRLFYSHDRIDPHHRRITELLLGFFGVMEHSPGELASCVDAACDQLTRLEYPDIDQVHTLFATFAHALLTDKHSLLLKVDGLTDTGDVERVIRESRSISELKQFVLLLCRHYTEEVAHASQYSRVVREVIDYISAHISKIDLDLRELADHVHLSVAHIGMLFKQETGKTIKQYIGDYRIELAKKLMASEHYKVNAVAELCGYASASYFSKVFKSATDLTPLEYRRQCAR